MNGAMRKLGIVLFVLCFQSPAQATLFFSEYIEGSGNNKALEIFNAGSGPVDFSGGDYLLQFFFNGSTSPGRTLALTGAVATGDVWVVADEDFDSAYAAVINQSAGGSWYNGDDGIGLYYQGELLDFIGQLGVDPGSEWGAGLISTQNNTLLRSTSVTAGDILATDLFDPALEWSGLAQDSFTDLGSYLWQGVAADGQPVPLPGTLWLILLGIGFLILPIRRERAEITF